MKYKISELAKLLNVSTNTVRRYERFGHINSVRDRNNGYRYYSKGDLTRLMSVRVLRKYGFAHTDISMMKHYSIPDLIHSYQIKLKNMDDDIINLTNLRHRLKDDLTLLKKIELNQSIYIRECIAYSYILYQSGNKLLMEEERVKKIHEYLYLAPKVQMIYIIRKEDFDCDNLIINMGWAVKVSDLEQLSIGENDYTERYHTRKTLMSLEKLPVIADKLNKYNGEQDKELFLKDALIYMKKENLRIDGDLLGVKIATITEGNEELEYILFNIPIVSNE